MSLHNQTGTATPTNADEVLDLIAQHLPDLWQLHHRSPSRPLRAVLNATERVLQQQRGDQPSSDSADRRQTTAR